MDLSLYLCLSRCVEKRGSRVLPQHSCDELMWEKRQRMMEGLRDKTSLSIGGGGGSLCVSWPLRCARWLHSLAHTRALCADRSARAWRQKIVQGSYFSRSFSLCLEGLSSRHTRFSVYPPTQGQVNALVAVSISFAPFLSYVCGRSEEIAANQQNLLKNVSHPPARNISAGRHCSRRGFCCTAPPSSPLSGALCVSLGFFCLSIYVGVPLVEWCVGMLGAREGVTVRVFRGPGTTWGNYITFSRGTENVQDGT